MGRGTSNALADILDDEDVDELGADEEALEGEAEGEEQEDGNDYSEDSSDVDV